MGRASNRKWNKRWARFLYAIKWNDEKLIAHYKKLFGWTVK